MTTEAQRAPAEPSVFFLNNPKVRAALYQIAMLLLIIGLVYDVAQNARANLEAQRIATGFGFLNQSAGFGINQTLIPYSESDTYGRVFLVGLLNTLLVSGLGIVFATVIGFTVGIARLSNNWLVARLGGGYVELIRNLPLLFQILFWYLAVLGTMPRPRDSLSLFGFLLANNRGIFVPRPVFGPGASIVAIVFVAGIAATLALRWWARRRQLATGVRAPLLWPALLLIVGAPLVVAAILGFPVSFDPPQLRGFNFVGGIQLIPEFVALLIALSTYTAAFIAEVVRGGILAVARGQSEAAAALGLRRGLILRLVVLPQAMRVIVPPLTNQYLNLTKNSSLATAIGYPDLFAIFAGTTLNQTGQAIEIIAVTMAVYLVISLITSVLMNWYNASVQRAAA